MLGELLEVNQRVAASGILGISISKMKKFRFPPRHPGGCGRPSLPPRGSASGPGSAGSFPSASRAPRRAGRGGERGARRERPRAARGGRFYCFLSPSSSRAGPRRHWKAARAATRRRVIYRAGCARVTEPGPADWAADALGRGAESVGLRAGRRRQWASVCAAAAAGGWGRGASGSSPTPLPLGRDPRKGSASTSPVSLPTSPNMTREGDLSGRRGPPRCAPRGAGPTPGAPSRGRGDRGAGSAGQEANLGVWREERKRNFSCVTD
ncbi:uncharacterized protein LOC142872320 [Microcebus murinus]|uniref:uncharacterized protein LOC142872320 n=1 Tax=Microcebus murinus TaxID=30608 RepID=UPI003F6A72F4